MKFNEIKDLTVEELKKRERSLKSELFMVKMKHALGQVSNPLLVRSLRKDIAKVKTSINQKLAK